jgi:hypothetical protein
MDLSIEGVTDPTGHLGRRLVPTASSLYDDQEYLLYEQKYPIAAWVQKEFHFGF